MENLDETSNSGMLDLYDDLITDEGVQKEEDYKQLEGKYIEALEKISSLEKELKERNTMEEELKKKQETLEKNITNLLVTARAELQRKDRELGDLRKKMSAPVFRKVLHRPNLRQRTASHSDSDRATPELERESPCRTSDMDRGGTSKLTDDKRENSDIADKENIDGNQPSSRKRKYDRESDMGVGAKKYRYERDKENDYRSRSYRGNDRDRRLDHNRHEKDTRRERADSRLPHSKYDTAKRLLERSKKDLRRKSSEIPKKSTALIEEDHDKARKMEEDENKMSFESKSVTTTLSGDREVKDAEDMRVKNSSRYSKERSSTPDKRHTGYESPSLRRLKKSDDHSPRRHVRSDKEKSPRRKMDSPGSGKYDRSESRDRSSKRNKSPSYRDHSRERIPSRKRNLSDEYNSDKNMKQQKTNQSPNKNTSPKTSVKSENIHNNDQSSNEGLDSICDIDSRSLEREKEVDSKPDFQKSTPDSQISCNSRHADESEIVNESADQTKEILSVLADSKISPIKSESNEQKTRTVTPSKNSSVEQHRKDSVSPRRNEKQSEKTKSKSPHSRNRIDKLVCHTKSRSKSADRIGAKSPYNSADKTRHGSPHKTRSRSRNKSPDRIVSKSPNKSANKRRSRSRNKSTDRYVSKSPNKLVYKRRSRSRNRSTDRIISKSPNKLVNKTRSRSGNRSPDRIISKSPNKLADKRRSRSPKRQGVRKTSKSPDSQKRDTSRGRRKSKTPEKYRKSKMNDKENGKANSESNNKHEENDIQKDKFKSDDIKITVQMTNSANQSDTREIVLELKGSRSAEGDKQTKSLHKKSHDEFDEWDAMNYRSSNTRDEREKLNRGNKRKDNDGKQTDKKDEKKHSSSTKKKEKSDDKNQCTERNRKYDESTSNSSDNEVSPKMKSFIVKTSKNRKEEKGVKSENLTERHKQKVKNKHSQVSHEKEQKKNNEKDVKIKEKDKIKSSEQEQLLNLQKDREALLKEIEMLGHGDSGPSNDATSDEDCKENSKEHGASFFIDSERMKSKSLLNQERNDSSKKVPIKTQEELLGNENSEVMKRKKIRSVNKSDIPVDRICMQASADGKFRDKHSKHKKERKIKPDEDNKKHTKSNDGPTRKTELVKKAKQVLPSGDIIGEVNVNNKIKKASEGEKQMQDKDIQERARFSSDENLRVQKLKADNHENDTNISVIQNNMENTKDSGAGMDYDTTVSKDDIHTMENDVDLLESNVIDIDIHDEVLLDNIEMNMIKDAQDRSNISPNKHVMDSDQSDSAVDSMNGSINVGAKIRSNLISDDLVEVDELKNEQLKTYENSKDICIGKETSLVDRVQNEGNESDVEEGEITSDSEQETKSEVSTAARENIDRSHDQLSHRHDSPHRKQHDSKHENDYQCTKDHNKKHDRKQSVCSDDIRVANKNKEEKKNYRDTSSRDDSRKSRERDGLDRNHSGKSRERNRLDRDDTRKSRERDRVDRNESRKSKERDRLHRGGGGKSRERDKLHRDDNRKSREGDRLDRFDSEKSRDRLVQVNSGKLRERDRLHRDDGGKSRERDKLDKDGSRKSRERDRLDRDESKTSGDRERLDKHKKDISDKSEKYIHVDEKLHAKKKIKVNSPERKESENSKYDKSDREKENESKESAIKNSEENLNISEYDSKGNRVSAANGTYSRERRKSEVAVIHSSHSKSRKDKVSSEDTREVKQCKGENMSHLETIEKDENEIRKVFIDSTSKSHDSVDQLAKHKKEIGNMKNDKRVGLDNMKKEENVQESDAIKSEYSSNKIRLDNELTGKREKTGTEQFVRKEGDCGPSDRSRLQGSLQGHDEENNKHGYKDNVALDSNRKRRKSGSNTSKKKESLTVDVNLKSDESEDTIRKHKHEIAHKGSCNANENLSLGTKITSTNAQLMKNEQSDNESETEYIDILGLDDDDCSVSQKSLSFHEQETSCARVKGFTKYFKNQHTSENNELFEKCDNDSEDEKVKSDNESEQNESNDESEDANIESNDESEDANIESNDESEAKHHENSGNFHYNRNDEILSHSKSNLKAEKSYKQNRADYQITKNNDKEKERDRTSENVVKDIRENNEFDLELSNKSQVERGESTDVDSYPQGLKTGYRIPKLKPKVKSDSSKHKKRDRSHDKYSQEKHKSHRHKSENDDKCSHKSDKDSHKRQVDKHENKHSSHSDKHKGKWSDYEKQSSESKAKIHHRSGTKHDKRHDSVR